MITDTTHTPTLKTIDEVYDVLAAFESFFAEGTPVYPSSLNPYGIEDETMHAAVVRVLRQLREQGMPAIAKAEGKQND